MKRTIPTKQIPTKQIPTKQIPTKQISTKQISTKQIPIKQIPSLFKINTKEYYSSEDLNEYDIAYFTGTHRNLRGIIKKKNIPESAIIYAYIKDTKIIPSTESYVRAKLYLEAEWVKNNVPKMMFLKNNQSESTQSESTQLDLNKSELNQVKATKLISKQIIQSVISENKVSNIDQLIPTKIFKSTINTTTNTDTTTNTTNYTEHNAPINIDDLYDIPPAPEILYLSEDEMFKDPNGNVIEIEVRGERDHNKCFFKVKDIMTGFDMPSLEKNIKDAKSAYEYNEDYILLDIASSRNSEVCKNHMYLTYNGILRVLFASHSKTVKRFINWATETLFVHQMGTIEQKQSLSGNLIGVSPQTIKNVFNTASNKTPTVYLFYLGLANQLLKTNTYSDDDYLCKFGCTDDISRRTSEHMRNYKKQYGTDISLLCYSIIDPQYIFDAETNIRGYFRSNKISPDDKTELITINKNNLGQIKQHYKMMQNSYIGRYEEMNKKITELEKEIIIKNHQLLIKDKELELKDKDIQLEKQKSDLLEMKLMMLKFQTSGITNLSF